MTADVDCAIVGLPICYASGYRCIVDRREELAEVAIQFHGLTMKGGFLNSFETAPSRLDEVVAAFDLLDLEAAATLIRAGIELIPGSAEADPDTRRTMVDGMSDNAAAALEDLGSRYTDLVSDTLLGGKIAKHAAPREEPRPPRSVPDMLAEYTATALERDAALKSSKVARANRLFGRNHHLYMRLRLSEEGRDGIWELRRHHHSVVREAAVTHSLPWHPDEAAGLLEDMEAAGSFDAKWI